MKDFESFKKNLKIFRKFIAKLLKILKFYSYKGDTRITYAKQKMAWRR